MKKYLLLMLLASSFAFSQSELASNDVDGHETLYTYPENKELVAYYFENQLYINGYIGVVEVTIYTLHGTKVFSINETEIGNDFSFPIRLNENEIYIVQVLGDRFRESFKITTQ